MKLRFLRVLPGRCLFGGLLFTLAPAIRAQVTEPPHPILSISGSGSGADSILTTYSETQFLQFVPEVSPRSADYGFAPAVVAGDNDWSWSASAPNQLKSLPSGTIFPSPSYPIQYQAVPVLSGKTLSFPYYLAAGSTSKKSFVFGEIAFRKREQLRKFFDTLAPAYVKSGTSPATRNDAYARRIAIALDAWANYVPDYYLTPKNTPSFISAAGFTKLTSDIQRASDHNGMAHEWTESELFAIDAIYDSQALADLSLEKGYDVRAHILAGLYFNIGDYFRDRVPVSLAIGTNLSGPFSMLAKTARVLNRPDYILWMGDYLDATVRRKIMRDGTLGEGISYSTGYLTENLDGVKATRDYFLTRPADTERLEEIFLSATDYANVLQGGLANWDTARLPNGQLPPFGDTTFSGSTARNAGNSTLLPAYGHLALGSGAGTKAVQLNQNFSDEANHMRADVTGYSLWANGVELLGNVRYHNGTPGRQFTEQILAHNAVTIDRTNMSRAPGWNVGGDGHKFTSGNVTLFEPVANGLGVSELDGQRPYANKASRYQRIMLLNTVDPDRPYVVDVFRITGGTTHDYTHYGSIRFDSTAESTLLTTPMSGTYPLLEGGEVWVEPTSSGSSFPYYGFFRNVSEGTSPNRFQVTYRDNNTASKRDVRLWMTGEEGSKVYLGISPVAERQNGEPPDFYKYWRPTTIVRHRVSSGPLESLYASVVEPMIGGVSTIQAVSRLPLTGGGQEAVALRVWFTDGRFDTYLINLRNPKIAGAAGGAATISTTDGEYALTGRIGAYVSRPAGGSRVWTIGATSFQFGTQTATNPVANYAGSVIGMTRKADGAANNAFIVDAILPVGTALQGRQLSLAFGDYQVVGSTTVQKGISEMFLIDHVEQIGGQTHVVLAADHKLKMAAGSITEQVAPERTFTGANSFEIVLSASAPTVASPTPPAPPTDLPPPPPPPVLSTTPKKVALAGTAVTASGWSGSYVPANTVDGNLSTRWAGRNDGVWIQWDLGAARMIDYVKLAWHIGNSRTYTFDLQISLDGATWTEVITRKTSSGTTTALETYDFPDTYGRYVRFIGHMSSGDAYSNITEFEAWADDRAPAAAPMFDPAGGTFNHETLVTLSAPTAGTSIRYTLDGSAPTRTTGTPYTGPLFVDLGNTTIKALAFSDDPLIVDSAVSTASYSIVDNTPPALSLPANITHEATSPAGASVTFSVTAEDDFDGTVAANASPASGSTFALGDTTVFVTAADHSGNTANGHFVVSVVDTTPPVLTLPANLTLEATSSAGATATFHATATDLVSGDIPVSYSRSPGTTFPFGTTSVTATAVDAAGNKATGTFTVTVVDTTAPVFQSLTASRTELWPVNHKMVSIRLTPNVTDAGDAAPTSRILSVTSNEPVNGSGDGNTASDWIITGALTVDLRAERAGPGSDRIYTITVESRDASGNASTRNVSISVPHDQGNRS